MSGFVYIWRDRKHNRYYLGSHWGAENDGYICSSNSMRDAYRRRPYDFRRKIIKKIYTNRNDLLNEEQRWLNMIQPHEFGIKYYNINTKVYKRSWWMNKETKKFVGNKIRDSHKEAYKNGRMVPWNKGKTGIYSEEHKRKISRKGSKHSEETKIKMSESRKNKPNSGQFIKGNMIGEKTRMQKGHNFGKETRFIKGHIPWNKNMRYNYGSH